MRLEPELYRRHFESDARLLIEIAHRDLDLRIPSCPGWSMATLVTHLAGIYAHRVKIVELRAKTNIVRGFEDLDLPMRFEPWFDAAFAEPAALPERPDGLVELLERTSARLAEVLWSADPNEVVYTWSSEQSVGFWQRRMAHETAVHRWDSQLAGDRVTPIDGELAADGVDEVLEIMLPRWRSAVRAERPGSGESYCFRSLDRPGQWLIRFDRDSEVISRELGPADVEVRATASDLDLFLWGRDRSEGLEVLGQAALLERYFQMAPVG